jgi:hypothetical protein
MFLSNFDNSWDSYLDDFIEKAHTGLTLAWGSGVGFWASNNSGSVTCLEALNPRTSVARTSYDPGEAIGKLLKTMFQR